MRRKARQFQPRRQNPGFKPIKNVGAGLLAKAVCQSLEVSIDPPLSRASPLPHWGMRRPLMRRKARQFQPRRQNPGLTPIKIVGAGLLAKAVCQSLEVLTDPPLSRASPLPHWGMHRPLILCKARQFQPRRQNPGFTPIKNVGAGLPAKAVCQSLEVSTDPPLSRASPLPHSGMHRPLMRRKARQFQPRRQNPGLTPIKIVGAGLLAKAVCQSLEVSIDPPLSRASPLPHWGMHRPLMRRKARQFQPRRRNSGLTPIKNVGAGLLAKAVCQSLEVSVDPPLSRASPLPHSGMHRPLMRRKARPFQPRR